MFKTIETFDTEFSADSIEWCPIEGFTSYFVCGTYQLLSAERQNENAENSVQTRLGRIYLFQVISPGKLHLSHQVNVPAVLDMKWAHVLCQERILLGVVNSVGYLQLWILEKEEKITLLTETRVRIVDDEYLALSLDWSTGRNTGDRLSDAKIVVSDSKGFISVYHTSQGRLSLEASIEAHQFEAWITAFNYWNTNIIYSGGDDCKLKWFDVRNRLQMIGSNDSHHSGVTSLHSNAAKEFIIASGSYDETLRLWDTRHMHRAISEIRLTGGIWRLKWDPFDYKYLFAACMHSNFKIIDCTVNEDAKVIGEFKEHDSIAYGCDWSSMIQNDIVSKFSLAVNGSKTVLAATCSFYDHTLKLCTVNLPG